MGGAEQVRLSAEKCKRWSFYKEKKLDSVPNTEEVISQYHKVLALILNPSLWKMAQ